MTFNQLKLIRSIQLAVEKVPHSLRLNTLLELCQIRVAYGVEEHSGLTYELALEDLWERLNEEKERLQSV